MILFKKKEAKIKEPEFRFYLSIDSLPFWNYEKIISTSDLRYLVVTDYYDILPAVDVDENTWNNINIQCFEATGGQKAKNYILELSHIVKLRKEYLLITDSTYVLCYKEDLELIKIVERYIKKYSPNFEFKHATENERYNSIIEVDRQAKGIKTNIEIKEFEFNKKHNKAGANKLDLYKTFGDIQRYYKLQLDPRKVSTRQFLEFCSTMSKEIIAQNAKRKTRN